MPANQRQLCSFLHLHVTAWLHATHTHSSWIQCSHIHACALCCCSAHKPQIPQAQGSAFNNVSSLPHRISWQLRPQNHVVPAPRPYSCTAASVNTAATDHATPWGPQHSSPQLRTPVSIMHTATGVIAESLVMRKASLQVSQHSVMSELMLSSGAMAGMQQIVLHQYASQSIVQSFGYPINHSTNFGFLFIFMSFGLR